MDKLRNSTHQALRPAHAVFSQTVETKISERDFSRMLIVMSVKLTLTYELLKLNSALKLIFSVIEDQCSGGQ